MTDTKLLTDKNFDWIDIIKLICSILIAASHCLPIFRTEILNLYYSEWFFRFSVPLFFLAEGFFMNIDNLNKIIFRLLKLYIICTIIYLPVILTSYHGIKGLVYTLVFGYHHLWFLISSVYAVIIIKLLFSLFRNLNNIYVYISFLCMVLYLIGTICSSYSFLLPENSLFWSAVRIILKLTGTALGCLTFAFPIIFSGHVLRCNINKVYSVRCMVYVMSAIIIALLSFLECTLLFSADISNHHDMTLLNPVIAMAIFCLAIRLPNFKENSFIHNHTVFIRRMSLLIYQFHVIFIILLEYISNYMQVHSICVCTIIISVLFSVIYLKLSTKVTILKRIL